MQKTFRELYCERHHLPLEKFERVLVARSLSWQAKPFWWLLGLNDDYTSADREFVRSVGGLRKRRDFRNEVFEFHNEPSNRRFFLRRVLGMRVSGEKLQKIFEQEMTAGESTPPMSL
ncbi:hypothetical protein [Oleiharenicola lentus]|uniref:hypothetical protein n=1 Tax=Oleiharenicola lentus TaxID=2508720 RepID=UPI003F66BFD6